MRSILYITYDGLTDPLGQSQILAYLKRLSENNNQIVIISFEKEELFKKNGTQINEIINKHHLIWVPLTYTKRPPVFSTVVDIIKGTRLSKKLYKKYRFQIVHCRGYIPSIIGKKLKEDIGLKFIFDMRGWWADEKLESGFWNGKLYRPVYKYFKKLEKDFFQQCDYAVSLTYKGKEKIVEQQMAEANKIGVIPTCVDFEIFKPPDESFKLEMRKSLGIELDEKVFVYSGSLGGNYNPEILVNVFKKFQKVFPKTFLLILSKDAFDENLKNFFLSHDIERMAIYNSAFTSVTNYLRAADVGFIYYKMSFSTIGRSPTKLGEYWASGIPVISFKGIGDIDYILKKYQDSGILLLKDEESWEQEISKLCFPPPEKLRQYSQDYFHINKGVEFYQTVYEKMIPSVEKSILTT